jgi:hypothetical protein
MGKGEFRKYLEIAIQSENSEWTNVFMSPESMEALLAQAKQFWLAHGALASVLNEVTIGIGELPDKAVAVTSPSRRMPPVGAGSSMARRKKTRNSANLDRRWNTSQTLVALQKTGLTSWAF